MLACAPTACGSNGVPIDDFVPAYDAAFCAMLVRCRWASDESSCIALTAQTITPPLAGRLPAVVGAAKAGKVTYDGRRARACLDAFANASCHGFEPALESVNLACQGIFSQGTVAVGEPCTSSLECLSGSQCWITNADYCTGTCKASSSCEFGASCAKGQVCDVGQGVCVDAIPAGAAGEPCGNQDHACQPGLYCAFSTDVCEPLGKEGEGCGDVLGCGAGLICTPLAVDPTLTVGVCRKVAAKGEPCQAVNQCGGFLASSSTCDMSLHVCVDDTSDGPCFAFGPDSNFNIPAPSGCDPFTSYCDTASQKCVSRVATGGACTDSDQCDLAATCVYSSSTDSETCVALPVCSL
jgi:hypothetical protein